MDTPSYATIIIVTIVVKSTLLGERFKKKYARLMGNLFRAGLEEQIVTMPGLPVMRG
jgi:hypothetical protein